MAKRDAGERTPRASHLAPRMATAVDPITVAWSAGECAKALTETHPAKATTTLPTTRVASMTICAVGKAYVWLRP